MTKAKHEWFVALNLVKVKADGCVCIFIHGFIYKLSGYK